MLAFTQLIGLCVLALAPLVHAGEAAFINRNVLQTLDVFQAYVRQSFELNIENVGSEPEEVYKFLIPGSQNSAVAMIESRDVLSGEELPVRVIPDSGSEHATYEIVLARPVQPEGKTQIAIAVGYADGPVPYPASGKQSDAQFMLYRGLRNYLSVYPTTSQETQVTMLSEQYELLDEGNDENPKVDATGFLVFGPYSDVEPLSSTPLTLRYANPTPQVRVEQLKRSVWVSHWGNSVSFDESYDIHNVGTKLDGSFSRAEFTRSRHGNNLNSASIRAFRIPLPETHREEYYVDLVGNISTSIVRPGVIDLLPRYPVMGGWFYNFTVGWAADLGKFVHSPTPSSFVLELPMVAGPDAVTYGKVVNTIVLPEGATNVEVVSQDEFDDLDLTTTYSYLDLYGRPTVQVEYSNVVSEMRSHNLYVSYNYTAISVLRKPVTYFIAVFCVLVSAKVFRRLI